MPLTLSTLKPASGSRKKFRRFGRGIGSGRGVYSGKGRKGQKARAGGRKKLKLKGLRKLVEHLPKIRGFRSTFHRSAIVHVYDLNMLEEGTIVTSKLLRDRGCIRDDLSTVKILGDGELTKKLTIKGCRVSASAKTKIEKAGGTIEVIKS